MPENKEIIYESAESEPDDEFWLEQGKKMREESLCAVREAAKALITGLGLLKGIYLGILGFADYVPKEIPLSYKSLFIIPLFFWLIALYHSLEVMMTKRLDINLLSPDDIRQKSEKMLLEKHSSLQCSYWTLTIGVLIAILLLIFRQYFEI